MTPFWKAVLARLIRGFLSGAVSAMVLVVPNQATSWTELVTWLNALGLAGLFGGVTGLLLAFDKALRWEDNPPVEIDSLPQ